MIRFLRSALVIARRDFTATVLSKTFIFFLLGPLFPLLLGGLFGSIGARVATQAERPTVAVVMSPAEFEALWQARHRLAQATGEGSVVKLVGYARDDDSDALVKRLLGSKDRPVRAVLTGWFGDPRLVGNVRAGDDVARQVAYLLDRAIMPDGARSPTLAIGSPNGTEAVAAALFPLSSPMAMLARAAEVPGLSAHFVALVWQLLWVAVILRLGARLFRRTVLNSGPRKRWWRFKRA